MAKPISGKKRNRAFLAAILPVILFGLIFIDSAKAYPNGNERFYLNIDSLNLDNKEIMFDVNNVKSAPDQDTKKIGVSLQYSTESSYDADNNGIESPKGVIDFSVAGTKFNWNADKSKLCTRWEIYSIDSNQLAPACYGNDECCEFAGLEPGRNNWDEPMYLTNGMHGATENNIVSAQVIYVDFKLGTENPYSEIYYSRWDRLPAVFKDGANIFANISLEDALKNIEEIKSKNSRIKKIGFRDEEGNDLKEFRQDKNMGIIFNVSKSSAASGQENEIIVSINGFDAAGADWNSSNGINILTENRELSSSLEERGIIPKEVVSVTGVNDFLGDMTYYGAVKLSTADQFNRVIYCPEDKIDLCRAVPICIQEFKEAECYIKNGTILTVYVPHFSSVIIALANSTINLTIGSPDNSTALQSGGNVTFSFTANMTVNSNYSLDGQNTVSLGAGMSFNGLLSGALPYGVLENGGHNLVIYAGDNLGNSAFVSHSFSVNDTHPPTISVSIANNSAFSGTSSLLAVNVSSDEYASASYSINDGNFSSLVDLGQIKSRAINLTLKNGMNSLTVNSTDYNNNRAVSQFSFNFTLAGATSCSDAVQNGGETGIDCGGSCFSCINFSATTDRDSYNLTDSVYITVIARSNSSVNVTVSRQNVVTYRHTFVPVFSGAPIAESRIISNTTDSGNYTINAVMNYLNITEERSAAFKVVAPASNPISVTINANATTVNEGDTIQFSSAVSGAAGPFSYRWDFQNDGTADNTSENPLYIYRTNGTYAVNLTVNDSRYNQTDIELITVRKLYNLSIIVKDNSTSGPVENAEVRLEGELKNTSAEGRADYLKNAGRLELDVKKSGYIHFSNKTEINGNSIISVNLIEDDNKPPIVKIAWPEDKMTLSNNSVLFRYAASDKSSITCRLYLSSNSSLWRTEAVHANIASGAESSFVLGNLKNGTYSWKIECIDRSGNSNFSEAYSFTVDTSLKESELSIDLQEQDNDTEDISARIDAIMAGIDGLGIGEKEAADAMHLKKSLEKAKIELQRANRDLHSLKWRKLNQSEIGEETKKIMERIENVRDTTPARIGVIEKNEFVKYPNKEDVGGILQAIINSTNFKFTRKELNKLIEENYKLQSLTTITTKSKIINVEYISGGQNEITLVQKTVDGSSGFEKTALYEVIPKEIAKNLSEIELLFDYDVVEQDPILKIDVQKINEYSYYFNKKVSLQDTEKIKSILLNKDLKPSSKNAITGFASFDKISSALTSADLIRTLNLRLAVELMIIGILLAIFLYYQFGESNLFMQMFAGKEAAEIKGLVSSALNDLTSNKYEDASSKYKKICSGFSALDSGKKEVIRKQITELGNMINLAYIRILAAKAESCIKSGSRNESMQIYAQIQSLYKIVPESGKAEVSKKCLEIYGQLSKK